MKYIFPEKNKTKNHSTWFQHFVKKKKDEKRKIKKIREIILPKACQFSSHKHGGENYFDQT